ncbi:MAG: SDR family oxidoreductase [Alphaproteobacteria bacterium]|nr:SDR family oxidoreductase [Alphaproteobacteria bacterium]
MAHVLIVGASRGIGLAFARLYAARGDTVVGTTRHPERAAALAGVARVEACDVASDASVAALAARLDGTPIDVLLHNAGELAADGLDPARAPSVLHQLDVNAVGAYRVVSALRPHLARSPAPRVALMSSRMGSIGDNTSGGYYGYRASKAALNAIGRSLAHDLSPVPVLLLHPGYVRTELTGGAGDVDPDEAVARLVRIIDSASADTSGRFWHRDGPELPW